MKNRNVLKYLIGILMVGLMAGCATGSSDREQTDANLDLPAESGSADSVIEEELGGDAGSSELALDESGADSTSPAPVDELAGSSIDSAAPNETQNAATSGVSVSIVDLKYIAKKQGGTIEIDMSGPATFQTREIPSNNQFVLEIANAQLPESLKRPYVTKDFKQNIASINAYQDRGSTTARIVVQLNRPASPQVMQDGSTLRITAEPMGEDLQAQVKPGGDIKDATPGANDAVAASNKGDDEVDEDEIPQTRNSLDVLPETSVGDAPTRFSGKRISIEVADAPVTDVIRLISDLSGANIIVDAGVTGSVNMKLRKVPWDQALLLILQNFQLGYVKQGNILRIGQLERIRSEMDLARQIRDSQRQLEAPKIKIINLSYARATELVQTLNNSLSSITAQRPPSQQLMMTADTRTNSLVIRALGEDIDRAVKLAKALDDPPKQVLIEAKVVEASEQFQRKVGIQWSHTGIKLPIGTSANGAQMSIIGHTPGRQQTNSFITLSNATFDSLGSLSAQLQLLELKDEVKVLSSPRILTVNDSVATITQDNKLPVQQVTNTNGTIITSFNNVSIPLELKVRPRVSYNQDVTMEVSIKRSIAGTADDRGGIPISQREAQTVVMVRNGQTAVIGGIYQSDSSTGEDSVPWLSKLPVIGRIFRSNSIRTEKNELILFLTPRIVNPAGATAQR